MGQSASLDWRVSFPTIPVCEMCSLLQPSESTTPISAQRLRSWSTRGLQSRSPVPICPPPRCWTTLHDVHRCLIQHVFKRECPLSRLPRITPEAPVTPVSSFILMIYCPQALVEICCSLRYPERARLPSVGRSMSVSVPLNVVSVGAGDGT